MLARHSLTYFVARAVPALLSVASLIAFTRLATPAEYGKFTVLLATIGFANAGLFWWLRFGLLRFLPGFDGDRRIFLATIAQAFIAVVLITIPLAFLLRLTTAPATTGWLFGAGIALLWTQAAFDLVQEIARSDFSPIRFGVLALARAALFLGFGIALLLLDFGATGLWLALMLALLAPTIVSGWSAFRGVRLRLADPQLFRRLAAYGMPLAAASGLNVVIDSSDRLIIAALLDTESAGVYSAGYELTQRTLVVVMNVVYLASFPLVMRAFEQNGAEAAREQLATNQSLLIGVGLPCVTAVALLSTEITSMLFGEQYLRATAIVPWIAGGVFLQGMRSYHADLSFQLAGQTVRLTLIAVAAVGLNVGFNFLWIPIYGIAGAAYATVVSYAAALVLSWSFGNRAFRLPRLGLTDLKTLAATAGMAAILLLDRPASGAVTLVAHVALALVVFGLIHALLNTGNIRGRLRHWMVAQGARNE